MEGIPRRELKVRFAELHDHFAVAYPKKGVESEIREEEHEYKFCVYPKKGVES